MPTYPAKNLSYNEVEEAVIRILKSSKKRLTVQQLYSKLRLPYYIPLSRVIALSSKLEVKTEDGRCLVDIVNITSK